MDLQLTDRRALVTGASQGIGRAIAQALAEEGCDLLLVSRNRAALEAAAAEIAGTTGRSVDILAADLSSQPGIGRVAAGAGRLDILVNNAGAIPPGSLAEVDDARWRQAWDLKPFGFIGLTRALYPALRLRRGVVLNVIGASGELDLPDYIAGSTGNAALMAFTRSLARQAARDGMRVVAINPGLVATERMETMLRGRAGHEFGDAERWRELVGTMPYGRAASPAEIAAAAAFLVSPRSAYTNGSILTIDGGG